MWPAPLNGPMVTLSWPRRHFSQRRGLYSSRGFNNRRNAPRFGGGIIVARVGKEGRRKFERFLREVAKDEEETH
jgi:hypothetical protein